VARDVFPPAWLREQCSLLQQRGAAALQRAWGAAAPASSRGLRTIKDMSKKTFDRLRATPWRVLARQHWKLLLGIVAVFLLIVIWKVPQWQAAGWQGLIEPKDLAKLQNDARTTLIQGLGGVVLLIGLYLTLRNLQLTQDRQITEHYTRAVEQLGSDKLELRLGAIYALERIARDSERDHWPIMEILTAYVREHSPWKMEEEHSQEELSLGEQLQALDKLYEQVLKLTGRPLRPSEVELAASNKRQPKLAIDIQAILTVVGRRTRTYGKGEDQSLNLLHTHLRGADLNGAQLQGAELSCTQLQRAHFFGAQLQGASFLGAQLQAALFWDAQLQRAHFFGAQLQGANLANAQLQEAQLIATELQRANLAFAQLQGANLGGAQLQGASLLQTQLQGAYLRGTQLSGARDLTIEQLSTVATLHEAALDAPLKEQIEQRYPHLLEDPED
jgi:hypothetical protein